MTETLHIKNFGPIKDIHLDIRPLTVLIGESGSGKSVLMKVLVLFRWIFKWHSLRNLKLPVPDLLGMDELLPNTGLDVFQKSDSEITYTIGFYTLSWRKGKELEIKGTPPPLYLKLSYIAETRGFIPSALKPQMPRGADFGFFFHEVFNEFGDSNEYVRKLEIPYLGIDYRVEKNGLVTEHHITGRTSKYDILIKHASSGIQNLVPLLSIVQMYASELDPTTAFNKTLGKIGFKKTEGCPHRFDLHIEEPELGLFPDAQRDLMNDLVRACFVENKHSLGIIMATHSPFILAHINNMLQAGQVRERDANAPLPVPPLANGSTAVYQVADGTCVSLLDQETGLIGDNAIDVCSEKIYAQFDTLLNLERHE
jgi:hypothetical protein